MDEPKLKPGADGRGMGFANRVPREARGLIRLVLWFIFPALVDPAPAPHEAATPTWLAESLALEKRRDKGHITAEEYEAAIRELKPQMPTQRAPDGGARPYVLLLILMIGAFIAYVAVVDAVIVTVAGVGRAAPPAWSLLTIFLATTAGLLTLFLTGRLPDRLRLLLLFAAPLLVDGAMAGLLRVS